MPEPKLPDGFTTWRCIKIGAHAIRVGDVIRRGPSGSGGLTGSSVNREVKSIQSGFTTEHRVTAILCTCISRNGDPVIYVFKPTDQVEVSLNPRATA